MKAAVAIEYCVECLFLGRALEIAQALLERFPDRLGEVRLRPGHEGVFNVFLDGERLLTADEAGRPPRVEAAVEAVSQALGRKG